MNFDFNEDQYFIKNEARRFLTDRGDMKSFRDYHEQDGEYLHPLWQEIAELGWLGVAIPEAYGGLGMSYLELCLIAEELGRVVAPVPLSSRIYLAVEAILRCGSEEQKQQYLPGLATGETIGTMAWVNSARDGDSVLYEHGKLYGIRHAVPHGTLANLFVVLAKNTVGESVLVITRSSAALKSEVANAVDPSQRLARLHFDAQPAELLVAGVDADRILESVFDRAAVLFAFEQLGGAERCQEMATEYVKERKTFNRAVGSYQAVKHTLATMYAQNELARSNAYYGAWALASDSIELPMAASAARISACECYEYASREGLHLHGGMGYTWELDCHLYLKRSRDLALKLGNIRVWNEKFLARTLEAMRKPDSAPSWLANC